MYCELVKDGGVLAVFAEILVSEAAGMGVPARDISWHYLHGCIPRQKGIFSFHRLVFARSARHLQSRTSTSSFQVSHNPPFRAMRLSECGISLEE